MFVLLCYISEGITSLGLEDSGRDLGLAWEESSWHVLMEFQGLPQRLEALPVETEFPESTSSHHLLPCWLGDSGS